MKGQDKEGDHLLKCPKIDEIPKLLRQFHDISGHDGINATFHSISSEYYWKGISKSVKEYVSCYF